MRKDMEILKFTLSGKQAIFKKPEVNSVFYFTYGHIHKPVLFGIFGAILGYEGYSQMKPNDTYPQYYQKLSEIKISIVPNADKGYFNKKVVYFNNSVGYASFEQGGNLIIKEQWLEEPSWDIYVLLDCDEAEKLADSIMNKKCVYIPYLGKNDHTANIKNAMITDGEILDNVTNIDCLAPKEWIIINQEAMLFSEIENPYKYEEALPVGLDLELNQYVMKKFIYTNMELERVSEKVYYVDNKNIVFY